MFQSLFKRAEATVDQAVTNIVLKILVAIPFLVALGFLTAAATIYVNRRFDTELGYLIMTGAFLMVGVIAALVVSSRNGATPVTDQIRDTRDNRAPPSGKDDPAQESPDHEMLMAALATVGPVAAPALIRLIVRNLPLVAAIAAAGFVLTRAPEATSQDGAHLEPAE